ncbi:MAG: hypothetical protein V5A23_00675 [Halobacteriales archaeon]
MATERCDGCGGDVTVGGGIAGLFRTDPEPTGGMTLELADGSEHFLCFDCIGRLPDDREPTAEDVAAL